MARNADRRGDPRALWADVRSIVMLGVNYGPDDDPLAILKERMRGAISVYAQGDDYHDADQAAAEKRSGAGSSKMPAATSKSSSTPRR